MTTSSGDHQELNRSLEKGDEQALGALFALHRERLWRMVNFRLDRRLRGRVDPDDVLQESYLAAAQRIEHYKDFDSKSPFLWLRMVVSQTMIDVHRIHLGAQIRNADREIAIHGCSYTQTTSASLAVHLVGNLTSPSRAAVRGEMVEQVEQAIAEMDLIDQEVLALRHFEELTNIEVAEVLNTQQKAASIRYIRAVRRLKAILSQIPGFLPEGHDDS
jgi:RNA polymerase sigma-70 factor (ECF subfamily)